MAGRLPVLAVLALCCRPAGAILNTFVKPRPTTRPHQGDPVLDTWSAAYVEPMRRYNLLTKEDVLLCSCDKCGTTSLYNHVYHAIYGKEWPYTDEPWEQDTYSERWDGRFRMAKEAEFHKIKYRFALIRDPLSRLLSGWKSKFACDESVGYGRADDSDRRIMVPKFFRLYGNITGQYGPPKYCLWIDEWAEMLQVIHRHGTNASRLDSHIRPQQYGCFRKYNVSQWTKVAKISSPKFTQVLDKALGARVNVSIPHIHASPKVIKHFKIPQKTVEILEEVTREEYKALGLKPPNSVRMLFKSS